MIICQRCGKENQDVYKFCLGCGAELHKEQQPAQGQQGGQNVAMMKTMMADVNPSGSAQAPAQQGMHAQGGGGFPPPGGGDGGGYQPPQQQAPQAQAGPRACTACGAEVPPNFKFCGVCGAPMDQGGPATAGGQVPTSAQQHGQSAPAPAPAPANARMTLIRPDGSEGGTHQLQQGENLIGRDHGAAFESDGYLSPTHAALIVDGNHALLRDMSSLNGVFVRMTEEEEVEPGQIIRIGQELLRFELIQPPAPLEDGTEIMGSPNPGYWGKITVIIGRDVDGSAYPLLGDSVTIGRERGDINFPDDGYVSGVHARMTTRDGKVYITDLGSSNGTFMKVTGERAIGDDSYILLGQQLFRVQLS
jgi:pSer/pThr/pTyr-binding forkhead associated (FHA) protein